MKDLFFPPMMKRTDFMKMATLEADHKYLVGALKLSLEALEHLNAHYSINLPEMDQLIQSLQKVVQTVEVGQ